MRINPYLISIMLMLLSCDFNEVAKYELTVDEAYDKLNSGQRGEYLINDTLRNGYDTANFSRYKCEGFYLFGSDRYKEILLGPGDRYDSSLIPKEYVNKAVTIIFSFPSKQPECMMVCMCDAFVYVKSIKLRQ